MRAAVVYPLADTMGTSAGRSREAAGWDADEIARRLAEVEEIAAKFEGPLVDVQLGPVGPTVGERGNPASRGPPRRTNRAPGAHAPARVAPASGQWADATYPEGIVELLDRAGPVRARACALPTGPSSAPTKWPPWLCGAACSASTPAPICGCARGRLPSPWPGSRGCSSAAGLDGLALADDADYWTELRLLRGLQQAQTGRTVAADDPHHRSGRRRSSRPGPGRPLAPAPGRLADFVLLDITGYGHLLPARRRRAVWTAADVALAIGRPERVAEVWVGGRCACTGGRPPVAVAGEGGMNLEAARCRPRAGTERSVARPAAAPALPGWRRQRPAGRPGLLQLRRQPTRLASRR